jgi:shikimate dehydrogenase
MKKSKKNACVIGDPIAHSLSPIIHGYWLAHYAVEGSYDKQHVLAENLEVFLASLAEKSYTGCNVTVPHKESVFRLLPSCSKAAQQIGAVNTVVMQSDGSLLGDNTDAYGFIENIRSTQSDWSFEGKSALVIGAGGASRAVVFGLLDAGVKRVYLTNRTVEKAQKVAHDITGDIEVIPWDKKESILNKTDLVANTTTLGMVGYPPLLINLDTLSDGALVTDIVYKPLETELLKQARVLGFRTVGGLGMLLHQAVPGFEAWFGVRPEVTQELHQLLLLDGDST